MTVTDTTPQAEWIDTTAALADWLKPLASGDILAMDTEFTRRSTFHPQLSLLQLAHNHRYALVDPLAMDIGNLLQDVLVRRQAICVMHSAGEDLEALAPWLPEGPAHLFDTQIAAAFAGLGLSAGYRQLVERYCDVALDKGETRSDWNRRPLTPSQCQYAVLDVVYLEKLHDELQTLVQEQRHEQWFAAECEHLKYRAHVGAIPQQPQRKLRAAAEWSLTDQALLRRILLWRERRARDLDKPRTWLLDDAHALDLIAHPPADPDAIKEATRGQRALRRQQRDELLALLQSPVSSDEISLTQPVQASPDKEQRRIIRDVQQVVQNRAGDLGIPAGLLCPRKAVEAIVTQNTWPPMLSGWRRGLLADALEPWINAPAA